MKVRKGIAWLLLWSMLATAFLPVSLAHAAEGETPAYLVDDLNDWSLTFSHSSTLTIQTSTDPADGSRVRRSSASGESIVYKSDAPLQSFEVYGYYNPNAKPYSHPIFAVSADGVTYTRVTPEMYDAGGYLHLLVYELLTLPADARYLKIQYTGGLIANSPLIGRVVLNGPASVGASPAPGLVDSGTQVTLATPTAEAGMYYTTDGSDPRVSATRQAYTVPLEITGETLLRAASYLPGGGAPVSHVSTFRYVAKNPDSLLLPALEDAHVDKSQPAVNYGSAASMILKSLNNREAYLKFDVSSLGEQIDSVYLNVSARASDPANVPAKLRVFPVGAGWTESALTFSNKPLPTPPPASGFLDEVILPYDPQGWIQFDVTKYVREQKWQGADTIAFAVVNASDGLTQVNSKEAAADAPFLIANPGDASVPVGLTDELNDFNQIFQRSNMRVEGADSHYFGGDPKRLTRNTVSDGFILYKTAYEIRSFSAASYFHLSAPVHHHQFFASANGTDFTEVIPTIYKEGAAVSNWQKFGYESFDVPDDTRYLKIVFRGAEKSWIPQLSNVVLNQNTAAVQASPPDGLIGNEPLQVTLTSPTEGAQIYYKENGDAEFKLYTGPVALTQYTVLETYAEKAGMQRSPLSAYTYYAKADLVVDRFGQIIAADFPEKVTDEAELRADAVKDEAYYGSLQIPADFDELGGLKDSKTTYGLDAKGFFSIQEVNGRKVMVSPQGSVYFSLGMNGITNNETFTKVTGREQIYEWLPPYEGVYKPAFLNSKDNFSFYMANLYKKFGKMPNSREFFALATERIKKWGFNSAGAWGNNQYAAENNLPYTLMLPLSSMEWAKITDLKVFDIFADDAEAKIDDVFSRALPPKKDDPLLIGYFIDNEYHYHKIATTLPKLKGSQVAMKRRLVQMLEEKYGTIEAFNASWEASFASFEAMNDAELFVDTDEAVQDIDNFMALYLDAFYGTVARAFKKYDPNHLLLGDRWLTLSISNTKIRRALAEASGKYLDVISLNHYTKNLDVAMMNEVHATSGGKPILLSEYSFGTAEQGLNPIVPGSAANQNERQLRYRNYVEGAASLGYVVGAHWFDYVDQAPTARWWEGTNGGEKYNTGLLNVADRPYYTFIDGLMQTHNRIYPVLLGQQAPFKHEFPGDTTGGGADDRRINIPYVRQPIPVDGVLNGFGGDVEKVTLTAADRVGGSGGENVSADYYFGWDATNLYVTVNVNDPTPMKNNFQNSNVWRGDAIEMFFGPEELETRGDLLVKDRQIIMSSAIVNGTNYWHWFNTSRQLPIDMKVSRWDDGEGYTLDAAIPWSAVHVQAEQGREILFDFGLGDSEDGNNRSRQFIWNGTSRNNADRGLWGNAVLTGAADADAPVITVGGVAEGGDYSDAVLPAVSAEDEGSGIEKLTVTLDGAEWTAGTAVTAPGTHVLKATAVDKAGNTAEQEVRFTVYGSTTLTVDPASGVYSDNVQLQARLVGRDGAGIAGETVAFRVNGETVGTAQTDSQGIAAAAYTVGLSVTEATYGPYGITAVYAQNDDRFLRGADGSAGLTVSRENASLVYAGGRLAAEDGGLLLAAQVNQEQDGSLGRVDGLPVRFTVQAIGADGAKTPLALPELEQAISTDVQGTASIGVNLPAGLYDIRAELLDNGSYTPAEAGTDAAVQGPAFGTIHVSGFVKLPADSVLGSAGEKLHLDVKLGGGGDDKWRLYVQPKGIDVSVAAMDWTVVTENRAYAQGKLRMNGSDYTVRLMLGLAEGPDPIVSVQLWNGVEAAGAPLEFLNTDVTGSVSTNAGR
ncbi:DNRLRE domain-containing protein [Paenibacillus sp.]|uniref:CBM96 family carbohydrate-binding protein n=1 Tax=Paenibacillus sp. TaxID=58172 RepID=UPI002811CC0C|nr:DNRLRE domain-containing protein [Paenibacillus sp.]